MQDLISYLQTHNRTNREDLACEILTLLLAETAGQNLIRNLFSIDDPSLSICVEARNKADECTPDIQIYVEGTPKWILELKFGAPLTDAQQTSKYASAVFVVPEQRVNEVSDKTCESARVLSWNNFLRLFDSVAKALQDSEPLFAAALDQFKEFCEVTEKNQFLPFTTAQLQNPTSDKQLRHLIWLIQETISRAIRDNIAAHPKSDVKLEANMDEHFYCGQNLKICGMDAWVGYWHKAWTRNLSQGPLWVQVRGKDARLLAQHPACRDGIVIDGKDLAFPLLPPHSNVVATQDEELELVLGALRKLAESISACPKV